MKEVSFDAMPLSEQAAFVQEKGQFLEAQDFYSFFFLVYSLNKQYIKLLYDFSGTLIAIENVEEGTTDDFMTNQLMSSLDVSE